MLTMYCIDSAVGKYCANKPDDVYLIRFFLRKINKVPELNGPFKDLPIIHTWDQQLTDAILWFQQSVKAKGKPVVTDGRVDPSAVGQGPYTIHYLNGTYMLRYPQTKHRVESDPEFPSALLPSFQHVHL
jgi:hypothetical protein